MIGIFGSISKYSWIITGVVFLCMCVYIYSLRADNKILTENNVKLELANQQNLKYIERLKEDMIEIDKSRENIQQVLNERNDKIIELSEKMNRLQYLSTKKPKLIENRINKGTKGVFDEIISISKE